MVAVDIFNLLMQARSVRASAHDLVIKHPSVNSSIVDKLMFLNDILRFVALRDTS
jgi:hypothetical protein